MYDASKPGAPLALDGVWLTLPSAAGPVEILRGVDFAIEPGERVAVVGPSGSGKSTLIAIAAGLERPSKGKVRLLGPGALAARRGRPGAAAARARLAGVPGLPPAAQHDRRGERRRAAGDRRRSEGERHGARLAGPRRPCGPADPLSAPALRRRAAARRAGAGAGAATGAAVRRRAHRQPRCGQRHACRRPDLRARRRDRARRWCWSPTTSASPAAPTGSSAWPAAGSRRDPALAALRRPRAAGRRARLPHLPRVPGAGRRGDRRGGVDRGGVPGRARGAGGGDPRRRHRRRHARTGSSRRRSRRRSPRWAGSPTPPPAGRWPRRRRARGGWWSCAASARAIRWSAR